MVATDSIWIHMMWPWPWQWLWLWLWLWLCLLRPSWLRDARCGGGSALGRWGVGWRHDLHDLEAEISEVEATEDYEVEVYLYDVMRGVRGETCGARCRTAYERRAL